MVAGPDPPYPIALGLRAPLGARRNSRNRISLKLLLLKCLDVAARYPE